MIGAEALLRWPNPRRGMARPSTLVLMAEEIGLVAQPGQWVLLDACKRLKKWSANPKTAHLSLSVNISTIQFRHPDFVATVLGIIPRTKANAHKLQLELVESVLIKRVEEAIQ